MKRSNMCALNSAITVSDLQFNPKARKTCFSTVRPLRGPFMLSLPALTGAHNRSASH